MMKFPKSLLVSMALVFSAPMVGAMEESVQSKITQKAADALIKAVRNFDPVEKVAKILEEVGPDVRDKDNHKTPLMLSARGAPIEVSELLIQKGADVDAQDHWGLTALIDAVRHRNMKLAKLLLANNCKVNAIAGVYNEYGATALDFV